jgi:3-oxoadipate enol-lactonase
MIAPLFRERFVLNEYINGINVHFIDVGVQDNRKPPIVLIHGFPFSSEMWSDQIQLLKDEHRVIAYDIRGHGKSDVGDGQYMLEFFVDDLIALLDHLNVSKAVLCGLSMGGYIALRAIERNSERFSSVILCDTSPQADTNEAKVRRAASIKLVKTNGVNAFAETFLKAVFAPESFQSKPREVEMIRRVIQSNSEIGICGTLLALAGRTDTTEVLSTINVPTLILVGEFDKVTPPNLSELMHDKIRNSEFHVLPSAAHLSNLENSVEFNKHLTNFVG